VREPLQRLRRTAQRPPPVVGLERPPRRLLVALSAAADAAAAGGATLALLDAAPRSRDAMLSELAEHERRVNHAVREISHARRHESEAPGFAFLASALTDLAHRVRDVARWWSRRAERAADLHGLCGALRDATRAGAGAHGVPRPTATTRSSTSTAASPRDAGLRVAPAPQQSRAATRAKRSPA
jgi:hypothetical protein